MISASAVILLGKLALAAGCLAAALLAFSWRALREMPERSFRRYAIGTLAASRLAVFAAVFLLARIVPSSDVTAYYKYGKNVILGMVPCRNFPCEYGYWFSYLVSLPLHVWDSPRSLILFAIVAEILSLCVWLAVARRCFEDRVVRLATILYVCSPVALVNVAIDGQNQVLIALFVGLAFLALMYERETASSVLLGISVAVVKFLSLLFAPALAVGSRKRAPYVLILLLGLLAIGGFAALNGLDALQPVKIEADQFSSGNLPYLLTMFGFDLGSKDMTRTADFCGILALMALFSAATIAGGVLTAEGKDRQRAAVHLATLSLLTLLLVSKKAYTNYLETGLFAICLSECTVKLDFGEAAWFGAFGAVALLEPSLWFRWMRGRGLGTLREMLEAGGWSGIEGVTFALVEILLMAFYVRYLSRTCRLIVGRSRAADDFSEHQAVRLRA